MIAGAVILVAYFLGAVPTAYLVARFFRGVDIRQHGSGNVGLSNVWRTVSRRLSVVVGIVDIGKGALAVFLAQRMGLDIPWQAGAGLAAIAGHDWSVFLRFTGGRGIATTVGVVLLLAPWGVVVFLAFAILGLVARMVPLGVGVGIGALPLASWALGEPRALTLGLVALFVLMVLKRLLANGFPAGGVSVRLLLNRLLYDRDVLERGDWVGKPLSGKGTGH